MSWVFLWGLYIGTALWNLPGAFLTGLYPGIPPGSCDISARVASFYGGILMGIPPGSTSVAGRTGFRPGQRRVPFGVFFIWWHTAGASLRTGAL